MLAFRNGRTLCSHGRNLQGDDLKQARKPRSYASPKLWPTHLLTYSLTGVKCRATSVAKRTHIKTFCSGWSTTALLATKRGEVDPMLVKATTSNRKWSAAHNKRGRGAEQLLLFDFTLFTLFTLYWTELNSIKVANTHSAVWPFNAICIFSSGKQGSIHFNTTNNNCPIRMHFLIHPYMD